MPEVDSMGDQMEKKTIKVVAAIIRKDNNVFATQRGYGDYKDWWEFPGGKIEPGETPEAALVREIKEELASEIEVDQYLTTVEHDYPEFHLSMDCYWCGVKSGKLTLLEHEAAKWLPLDNLRQVNWLPADVKVVEAIEKSQQSYQDISADTIDRWIREGWEWGKPISHECFDRAKNREWDVLLTPTKPVPHEWLGELKGKRILGLACGGGQQMPVFAALGAICTVLDYSPLQLESERMVAEREGYDIRIIRGNMTKRLPFEDGEFDIIFHPVSNCYVEEVRPIWKECFRVLKPGGRLLAGTDHYINYIVDSEEERIINSLPFNPLRNPDHRRRLEAADAGIQFSHSLEEQIGEQLEAGFQLLALYEDTNGEGRLHEMNIPTFLAMLSLKPN